MMKRRKLKQEVKEMLLGIGVWSLFIVIVSLVQNLSVMLGVAEW